MLNIFSLTIAFLIGIIWGIYLDFISLSVFLIFLTVSMLIIINVCRFKKILIQYIILVIVLIISYKYTIINLNDYKFKYNDEYIGGEAIILSHCEETEYYYSYKLKLSGDKFIANFRKKNEFIFDIGTKLKLIGEFQMPSAARNSRWI